MARDGQADTGADDPPSPPPLDATGAEALVREIAALRQQHLAYSAGAANAIEFARQQLKATLAPIEERLHAHTRALETYAAAHPELFAGQKSIPLGPGRIGWECSKACIECLPDHDEKSIAAKLQKHVLRVVQSVLKVAAVLGLPLGLLARIKTSLDREALHVAIQEGAITPGQLKPWGLCYRAGQDTFYVETGL